MIELTWFLVGVGLLPDEPTPVYCVIPSEQRTSVNVRGRAERMSWDAHSSHVSGTLTTTGRFFLDVPVASLKTDFGFSEGVLRRWLEAESHPTITFRSEQLTLADDGRWTVDGILTVRGVAKPVTLKVDIKPIPMKVAEKALGPGRWVRVSTGFDLKLSDFGIATGGDPRDIPDVWSVAVALNAVTEPRR